MATTSLIICYLLWGLLPVFWKQLAHIAPLEILFHRILWSFFFYGLAMILVGSFSKKGKATILDKTNDGKLWFKLAISSLMISCNWFLYIYAVNSGQILQGSLAYYMSPLISVLMGRLFFKETLSTRVRWAVGFCALGVLILTISNSIVQGHGLVFPWLAIGLSLSFALYSLVKKTVAVSAITSSFIEGLYFSLPAAYFIFFSSQSTLGFYTTRDWIFFVVGGLVTGVPLVLFSFAAQRLSFATIGFFQYVPPSLQLLLAVFVYSEDFSFLKMAAFACIWVGVAIYISTMKRPKPVTGALEKKSI